MLFLLQVFFAQPVVAVSVFIHLGSDGYTPVDTDTKYMRVDLLTPENQTIPVVPGNIPISCRENPVQVPIKQDLSKPFFLTQGEHIGNNAAVDVIRFRISKETTMLKKCMEVYELKEKKNE